MKQYFLSLAQKCFALTCTFAILAVSNTTYGAKPIRVVVWDEQQPSQKPTYENFLGNAIADHLAKQPGLSVKSVRMNDPEQGVSADVLDNCDVLIWWGHVRHRELTPEHTKAVVDRIKAGKLSAIFLHSAHWSEPFIAAMGERAIEDALSTIPKSERATIKIKTTPPDLGGLAPRNGPLTPSFKRVKDTSGTDTLEVKLPSCVFPAVRNEGKPSHIKTLLPKHPIAKGIPETFDIPKTEMYDEPFHVPKPDAVLFEERWDGGEQFHSGSVWKVGKGTVFYFRPGHETYPIFKQEIPLRIVENAVRFLGSSHRH